MWIVWGRKNFCIQLPFSRKFICSLDFSRNIKIVLWKYFPSSFIPQLMSCKNLLHFSTYATEYLWRKFYPVSYEDLLTFQWHRHYHIYEDKWELLENEYETFKSTGTKMKAWCSRLLSNYSWHTLSLFHCLLKIWISDRIHYSWAKVLN